VTTVLPEMDFSRPAAADPEKLLAAANDWKASQAFASPAVWRVLSAYCLKTGKKIPSLRQVFSCGAPVPVKVIHATLACAAENAKMHTPYGATECLPVSTIEAAEVLGETAARTAQGAGICVGRNFPSIEWRIIRITDGAIESIDDAEELPLGEIGELIVKGPQASPCYLTREEFNVRTKINGWHRTGDVGYFDEKGRFWYCGRKSQRVETNGGPLFTERVEALFSSHPFVRGAALVGIGPRGKQLPVIVYKPKRLRSIKLRNDAPHVPVDAYRRIALELLEIAKENEMTREIATFLPRHTLPVDVRHNAKINREILAEWVAKRLVKLAAHARTS
jgi:olefin beta-lactone synthetase